jgi:hypothetical protein
MYSVIEKIYDAISELANSVLEFIVDSTKKNVLLFLVVWLVLLVLIEVIINA